MLSASNEQRSEVRDQKSEGKESDIPISDLRPSVRNTYCNGKKVLNVDDATVNETRRTYHEQTSEIREQKSERKKSDIPTSDLRPLLVPYIPSGQ